MREELDTVLSTIGAAYLTAEEWRKAALVLDGRYTDKAKYQALFAVLHSRGGQGADLDNLHSYYAALGLSKADLDKRQEQGFSNIFIGAVLD